MRYIHSTKYNRIFFSYTFFAAGEPGDWKNWYTVSQNDMVNDIIRTNMENYESSIHFGAKYQL